jgi:acyl-CoA thioesterase II
MPSSAAEIVRLLDVEDMGGDSFVGIHPERSWLDKTYGGQLIAQALVAAARTVDSSRYVHSVQATCLDAARHGLPVRYEVERIRDGRSFSTRTVRAVQDNRPVLNLMASFHTGEPGLAHCAAMPAVPPPEQLPTLQDVIRDASALSDEEWRLEWAGLDLRYVSENLDSAKGRVPAVQQLWARVNGRLPDDLSLHRYILVYISDLMLLSTSLLPHGIMLGAPELPRATISHTVWLHEDARADEWLFIDQRSPWAGDARGLSFANVFTADGRHVASLAQEGLIRPRGELRKRLGLA